ncbi:metal-dependent transcriptional regulator [Candidatus Bathyarchaeota archaeon]|nr:metal-dependent transcriptional regulator [Candidatus Bathyarchaeota archaeon]
MSESIQEYLEAIYAFNEVKKTASNRELSKRLRVAPPSVTQMLQKLARDNIILYLPYKGVILTGKGTAMAQKVVRKHRLIETFLHDELDLPKEALHEEACKLEHSVSEEVSSAICRKINNPQVCSDDGNPIPPCINLTDCPNCPTSKDNNRLVTKLSKLTPGEKGKLIYMESLNTNFKINDIITVTRADFFDGPIEVTSNNMKEVIERELAEKIYIELEQDTSTKTHPHGPHHQT